MVLKNCPWFSFYPITKNCWFLLNFSDPNNWVVELTIKRQILNGKHQTQNIKHQTSNTKHQIPNSKHQTPNTKHQTTNGNSKPQFRSCFSFDKQKQVPRLAINWIKLSGKQIERPNQELEKLNQRWNNQQIFQELHQSKIRDP